MVILMTIGYMSYMYQGPSVVMSMVMLFYLSGMYSTDTMSTSSLSSVFT